MNDTLLLLSWANPFPALKHHPPINSVFLIWAAEKNTHIIRHCSFKRPLLCLFLLLCSTHSACIKQFGDPPSPLHCAHHIALSQRISPGFHSTHIPNPHRSTAATPESKGSPRGRTQHPSPAHRGPETGFQPLLTPYPCRHPPTRPQTPSWSPTRVPRASRPDAPGPPKKQRLPEGTRACRNRSVSRALCAGGGS